AYHLGNQRQQTGNDFSLARGGKWPVSDGRLSPTRRRSLRDPQQPDGHPNSSHCGEEKRAVEWLNCMPRPPQGILRGSAKDQEGADGGGVANSTVTAPTRAVFLICLAGFAKEEACQERLIGAIFYY